MDRILVVENLRVSVNGKVVIKECSFAVREDEYVLLLGPNGSGKTSLIQAIAGNPKYKVLSGRIIFNGEDITNLNMVERVRKGLVASFQIPPKIKGLTLGKLAKEILSKKKTPDVNREIHRLASQLNLLEFLHRDLNVGFSGGEIKRAELFLTLLHKPKLLLLDEIDSGVDLANLSLMSKVLQKYILDYGTRVLAVTHTGFISKYIKFDKGFIIIDGVVREVKDINRVLEKLSTGKFDYIGGYNDYLQ